MITFKNMDKEEIPAMFSLIDDRSKHGEGVFYYTYYEGKFVSVKHFFGMVECREYLDHLDKGD